MKYLNEQKYSDHEEVMEIQRNSPLYQKERIRQFQPDTAREAKLFIKVEPDDQFKDKLLDAYLKYEEVPLNRKEVGRTVFKPTIEFTPALPPNRKIDRIEREKQQEVFTRVYDQTKYCENTFYERRIITEEQFTPFAPETGEPFAGRRPVSPALRTVLRRYPIDLE